MVIPDRIHVIFVHGLFSSADLWNPFTALLTGDEELRDRITVHRFDYDSPRIRLRPDRRIADIDDIADRLGTWMAARCPDDAPIVLVSHSQGGLVVQRHLARRLGNGEARKLARIRQIVLYACPNNGSGVFLFLRQWLCFWRHPQERALRPLKSRALLESQKTVLHRVVAARELSDTECPVPVSAYGGQTDNVVPSFTAVTPFSSGGIIEGDHSSIVRPKDRNAESYLVLRGHLLGLLTRLPGPEVPPTPLPADTSAEEQGPLSIALPLMEGTLHGEERRRLIHDIVEDGTGVHVLVGTGGGGKSRLALEIATRAADRGYRVWWVRVNQLSSCMRAVARELAVPAGQIDQAWMDRGQADLVWQFLHQQTRPWLLVLDNADELRRLGPAGGAVRDGTGWLRPPARGGRGMVVVTSKARNRDEWGDWSQVHEVPPLDDGAGAALLIECAGPQSGSREQARHLSARLGGLPLALRTAAKHIRSVRENRISLDPEDIQDFESYGRAWARKFDSPAGTRGPGTSLGLDQIVDEVCGISLRLLESNLPQAGSLLRAFACLNIAPIPYQRLLSGGAVARSALWTGFAPAEQSRAIQGMRDLGLIEPDRQRGGFLFLHPVVHAILRDDEDVRRRRTDYYDLAVRMLLDAVEGEDPDYPDAWPVWATVMPHAVEVARSVLRTDGPADARRVLAPALELARLTSRYLLVAGHLTVARDLVSPIIRACDFEDFEYGRDDREILGLRHEKGRILLESGELREAEIELRAVAAQRRAIFGDLHADTLASLHKLARTVLERDRPGEALALLRKVVDDEQHVRGIEHADTMVVRHTLGRALYAQKQLAEAEEHMREILEIRLRKWAHGTPETLHARETLAYILMKRQKAAEAIAVIEEALRDAAQPDDSHPVLRLRYCHAMALLLQGRVEQADDGLTRLLADQERVLGPAHPEVTLTKNLLRDIHENL